MKNLTIKQSVIQIINDLPNDYTFNGLWLRDKVRELRDDKTMDGSATKLLRVCRQERKINYEVINRIKSLYKKLPVYNEPIYQVDEKGQLAMGI